MCKLKIGFSICMVHGCQLLPLNGYIVDEVAEFISLRPNTISVLVNTISGKFLEYVEYFTELYDEVVHMLNDSNKWFDYH